MGSEILINLFSIPQRKAWVTGVGIEGVEYRIRNFRSMNLVYLGALSNRYVHETVEGFAKFYAANKDKIPMSYKIIGGGTEDVVRQLEESIREFGDDVPIEYLGRLNDDAVLEVFKDCNIGVAYNKVTPYYTNNISTKLYEYLFSGMPVIAVQNNSMINVVNDQNGVLIEDTPEGFEQGLQVLLSRLDSFDSQIIAQTGEACSLQKVIEDKIVPHFLEIIKEVN